MDSEQFNNKGNRKLRPAKRNSQGNEEKDDDQSSNSLELELNRTQDEIE